MSRQHNRVADGYDLRQRGERIRAARIHRGILEGSPINQQQLAKRMTEELARADELHRRVEVLQTDVSKWEIGRKDIAANEAFALARVLGAPAGWLLYNEPSDAVPATLTTVLLGGRRAVGRPVKETFEALREGRRSRQKRA